MVDVLFSARVYMEKMFPQNVEIAMCLDSFLDRNFEGNTYWNTIGSVLWNGIKIFWFSILKLLVPLNFNGKKWDCGILARIGVGYVACLVDWFLLPNVLIMGVRIFFIFYLYFIYCSIFGLKKILYCKKWSFIKLIIRSHFLLNKEFINCYWERNFRKCKY